MANTKIESLSVSTTEFEFGGSLLVSQAMKLHIQIPNLHIHILNLLHKNGVSLVYEYMRWLATSYKPVREVYEDV